MPTKDNIIQFPVLNEDNNWTPEDVGNRIREYKESYSSELTEIIWENVLGEMARAGCNLDEDIEKYFPSMILVFEAIKSLHLQTMGVDHELQNFAEEHVFVQDSETPGSVTGGYITNIEETIDNDEEID
tara:strand:- start:54436 stop:54822 length:387 start_codon:yes stop_codon:yes gene_type:complete